ncbi:ComF family protein [Gorillibacterium sp. sgz5001074]|uniref:ComF family protein n=1 Tax=Gorillibacterium sp. sgz5001074 TaxID=3446695 RepID=UPI003F675648
MESPILFLENLGLLMGKGVRAFLSPSHPLCVSCKAQPRFDGVNPLGLCRECFNTIPWIRSIRCPVCGRYEDCPDCVRRQRPPLLMNRSAVEYDDRMKNLLALYKYRGDERLSRLLGRMLVHAYRAFPAGVRFDLLTYVPLSKDRLKERGFNQAEETARVLAGLVRLPVVPLLMRTRITEKMSFQSRQERLASLQGAFAMSAERGAKLRKHFGGRPLSIAIVDDVYTTGSTLNHCASAVHEVMPEAKVYGLCWAR